MFIVKCSWCNREISRGPGKNGVSHGICRSCYEKVRLDILAYVPRNINRLKQTVFAKGTLAPGC